MSIDQNPKERSEGYREILDLLEKNLRYLESLGFAEATIQNYRNVVAFLRSRSEPEVSRILSRQAKARKLKADHDPALTDEEIGQLSAEEVRQILAKEGVSRRFLERLASKRFGVSKGGLSVFRSRGALIEKIRTLLHHEGTHEAISRAASGPAEG